MVRDNVLCQCGEEDSMVGRESVVAWRRRRANEESAEEAAFEQNLQDLHGFPYPISPFFGGD